MPITRQVEKGEETHAYDGIRLSSKREQILPCAKSWTDMEGIMLSEINQERDKHYIISLTCRMYKNKQNRNKLIGTESILMINR